MNWQDCNTLADIQQYTTQALPGDSIAKAWREMLEDIDLGWVRFTIDDFIKVAHWRDSELQDRISVVVQSLADKGAFDKL